MSGYDSDSNVLSSTSAGGAAAQSTFDGLSNLTSSKSPQGALSTWSYSDASHPYFATKYTDPQGNSTSYSWQSNNLTKVTDDASNNSVSLAYNADGTVKTSTDPRGTPRRSATTPRAT